MFQNLKAMLQKRARNAVSWAIRRQLLSINPVDRALLLKHELEKAHRAAYPPHPVYAEFDFDWFKYACMVQTTLFYVDILPLLGEWLHRQPRGSTFRLLDVGGGSGSGAEFLAKLFWTFFTGYKISIDVLDVEDRFARFSPLLHDHISYKIGDVFELPDEAYDICLCSHTIEHVPKERAGEFINKVVQVSSRLAIFNAPYMENPLIPVHRYTIDEAFLATLPSPSTRKIYKSLGWYIEGQPSECIVFTYEKPQEQGKQP